MIYRVLKGNDYVLTHGFYAQDEETATDVTGSATVAVTREDGTALTGGTVSVNNGLTGKYNFTLSSASHTSELDELSVKWTATVAGRSVTEKDLVKVVGARYFNLAELRAMKGLQSPTTYPNALLQAARDIVEEFVEGFTMHAWVPSYKREILDGDGTLEAYVSRHHATRLIKVLINGTAQTTSNWSLSWSGRIRTDGTIFVPNIPARQNIQIEYEWGEAAPPLDLKKASLLLARHILMSTESSIPDRARMLQTEYGMYQLDTASENKPTGLPEIDAVLIRYRSQRPAFVVV